MLGERGRKISEDVASLDSWTDALNASTSCDSNYQHLSEDGPVRRISGSAFRTRKDSDIADHNGHHRELPLKQHTDSSCDVVDGAFTPTHRHKFQDIHINRSNRPYVDHVWFTDQQRPTNHDKPEDARQASGVSAWFNNLSSQTSSPFLQNYRPHALSTVSPHELRNISRFGISAQSQSHIGLPQTNITSTGFPGNTRRSSNPSNSTTNGGEFGSGTLSDQIDRESEKIKTKFMSAWNNVKYGWTLKTKTNFRCDCPIFLLGKCYHRKKEDEECVPHMQRRTDNRISNIDEFHQDFSSRMWFTYRRDFSPLPGTKLTTDCGWGCMLRSGQMLLAQGLISHFLGRDWGVYHEPKREQKAFYKEIIRWFADKLSDQVPFSIHKMVEIGQKHGKFPGSWYGPASVALILRDSLIRAYTGLPILNDVCVYVAQDCTVYKQDVFDLCQTRPKSLSQLSTSDSSSEEKEASNSDSNHGDWKRSVIVMIPMRLGGECLNPIYIPCVKGLLANDNCIGIIGGKPKHSLYFVGFQEDKLINLDPHYCQDVVDTTPHDFPVQSFHCVSPRKLAFNKMDPSCTVGFYLRTREQFEEFVTTVGKLVNPPLQKGLYPLFIFSEGRSSDINMEETSHRDQGRLRIRHYRVDREGNVRSPTIESEDFVIL